jgi:hypothetical protein
VGSFLEKNEELSTQLETIQKYFNKKKEVFTKIRTKDRNSVPGQQAIKSAQGFSNAIEFVRTSLFSAIISLSVFFSFVCCFDVLTLSQY